MWLNKWSSYGKKVCSFGIFGGEIFNFKDIISHFNAGDSAICKIAFQWVQKKKKKPRNMIIIVEKVICNSLLKIKTKKLFVIVNSQHCFYIFAVVHQ